VKVPRTLLEAIRMWAVPEVARTYFANLRWPNGVACPRYGCGSADVRAIGGKRPRWICRECKRDFTAKTDSIFEDSPIGFDKWLPVVWLLTSTKNGTSSCELARGLGVTQKTAWFMEHRVREGLASGTFEKLRGSVEADETYVGGKTTSVDMNQKTGKFMPTGPQDNKTIVMGIVERKGKVRAFVIEDTTRNTLHGKIKEHVAEGSDVHTDAWRAYGKLTSYAHFVINHDIEFVNGNIHTNNIENFWSLLKRAVKGTYICPRPWHLGRYVDTQAFRYNTRDLNDGGRFVEALKGMTGKRITWKQLTETVNTEQYQAKERQKAAQLKRCAARAQDLRVPLLCRNLLGLRERRGNLALGNLRERMDDLLELRERIGRLWRRRRFAVLHAAILAQARHL
jgi:transposase-like protein